MTDEQPIPVETTPAGQLLLALIAENKILRMAHPDPLYRCWRGTDPTTHDITCPRWCWYGHPGTGYPPPPENGWRLLPSQDPARTSPTPAVPIP